MEFENVLEFLENKTILITGAAGYVAKLLVEKILRVQPNVKKLYLLLRASDAKPASVRFQNEVIGKDVFKVLKEKCGGNWSSMIAEKISLVPGDICYEELRVQNLELKQEMWNDIDIIVNSAATTNFDERYDVAMDVNTMGAKHVLEFAKKCVKLQLLVHVSTAYVCGEGEGLIPEKTYKMGEALNGAPGLDIDQEKTLIQHKLDQLGAVGATQIEIAQVMKDMGIQRARTYGWPNTYVFTKAMGEMIIQQRKGTIPVVIQRPTIITSTLKEPFPGWAEGARTIDSLAIGYAKGRLTCLLGDLTSIVDVIPADMVVNNIIVSMVAHARKPCDSNVIYQVGSSLKNPLKYVDLQSYGFNYFSNKPLIGKDGKPIIVGNITILNTMASFHRYMSLRYLLPLKGLELANTTFCRLFQGVYSDMSRKINYAIRLVELYRPYLFFQGVFDDMNTEKLRIAARENDVDEEMFYFDPKNIDWEDYFMNIHIPGVVKHVLK